MEAKVNFSAVGAFVLILGMALVGSVMWLSSGKFYRKAYDTYLVYMTESVSGLSPDAPVRYRGVQVGVVRRIALAPNDVERVRLTLEIERDTPVKQDTVAILRTQGLTGIGHVELTGGTKGAPPLVVRPGEDYPVIPAAPSLMTRLDSAVTTLLGNVNRSSESFNALLDEANRQTLREILASLDVVSRALAARAAAIDAGVVNASKTMENTARATADLPQLIERIRQGADAFDRMANEGARAAAAATGTLEGVRSEVRQFGEVRQAAGEALPEARALLVELRELTATLSRFSDQLERNPAMLIHGRPAGKPGPGE